MIERNYNEVNITGQTFGDFTVIKRTKRRNSSDTFWICQCRYCGNHRNYHSYTIIYRYIPKQEYVLCPYCRGTGEVARGYTTRYPKLYRSYRMMKYRCNKPTDPSYKWYGARGIKVYKEWEESFPAFCDYVMALEHYGEPGRSLDRIDNNGDYCPGNVRWATAKQQCANKRPRGKNLKKKLTYDKLARNKGGDDYEKR